MAATVGVVRMEASVSTPRGDRPGTGTAEPERLLRVAPEPTPPRRPRRMTHRLQRRHDVFRVIADAATLAMACVLVRALVDDPMPTGSLVLFCAVAVMILNATTISSPRVRLRLEVLEDVRLVIAACSVAAMAAVLLTLAVTGAETTATDAALLWATSSVLLITVRGSGIALMRRRRRAAGGELRALIIGAGQVGRLTAARLLAAPELGIEPVGFVDKDPIDSGGRLPLPVLGASWDLDELVEAHGIDCVVVTFSTAPHDVLLKILDDCERLGVRALVVPRLFERTPSRIEVTHVGSLPLLEMMPTSTHSIQYAIKYAADRIVAFALLVLLSPILLVLTLATIVSLGRPVLYRQERVGLDGRHFEMLKFRSMRPGSTATPEAAEFDPEKGPGGIEGDDRRTRVGSFMRRTSLDELPQLLNVLRGEMSLVGPRPERPEFVEFFGESVRRYDARHRVKSGITGWAQINNLRGKTSIADRVEWDNYYIENFSLWLDLKILIRTIPAALWGRAE